MLLNFSVIQTDPEFQLLMAVNIIRTLNDTNNKQYIIVVYIGGKHCAYMNVCGGIIRMRTKKTNLFLRNV